jgi:hypothetical protein
MSNPEPPPKGPLKQQVRDFFSGALDSMGKVRFNFWHVVLLGLVLFAFYTLLELANNL